MNWRLLLATVFLIAGGALQLLAVLGLCAMRDLYDRVHYVSLAGFGATLGALALAGLALFGSRLRRRMPQALLQPVLAAVGGLRELHSGHVGDYVAWWTAGAALLGGASLVFLR